MKYNRVYISAFSSLLGEMLIKTCTSGAQDGDMYVPPDITRPSANDIIVLTVTCFLFTRRDRRHFSYNTNGCIVVTNVQREIILNLLLKQIIEN